MSKSSKRILTCSNCAAQQPFTAWDSINVTLNRDLKQKIISGELVAYTCLKCGSTGTVCYPLLYHDMEKQIMIWLWPNPDDPDPQTIGSILNRGYRLRLVSSRSELIEKIYIFEQEFDDRLIELFKLVMRAGAGMESAISQGFLFFSGLKTSQNGEQLLGFEHLNGATNQSLVGTLKSYLSLSDNFVEKLPSEETESGKWLRVDQKYAAAFAEKYV